MMIKFKTQQAFTTAKNLLSASFGTHDIYTKSMTIKFFTCDMVEDCITRVSLYGVDDSQFEILPYNFFL